MRRRKQITAIMDCRNFLVIVCALLHMGFTDGMGIIDIHFLSYADDCGEVGGLNKCDPMFTYCVTRPDSPISFSKRECEYSATFESVNFDNTDYINFSNKENMNGLANPWVFPFQDLHESSIKLAWRVRDANTFVESSEHLVTTSITLNERVWPNIGLAKYTERRSQKSDHILRFEIRIYCTGDTYGPLCAVHCPPPSVEDKYYCDLDTGDKICIEGWTGDDCDTNIDECAEGICVHGECTDQEGSYTCENCDDGYIGPNCDTPEDPCHETPCQGRGDCIPSTTKDDDPRYRCDCFYPYTGLHCDDESPTTTTTTTTTTTPSTTTSTVTDNGIGNNPWTTADGSPTTDQQHSTDSTKGPVAAASKTESAGFDLWIILVVGLCLVIVIGSIIIFFVCRRKKIIQRRKESRIPLPTSVTYDGENLAFDNVAYNQMDFNDSTQEGQRESLPPLPTAPRLSQMNPSFHPEKDVKNGHEEMDDDGYLRANTISTLSRDSTDGLTASGRRAQSNLYSNFNRLPGEPSAPSNPEYEDEQHYHDLDEAAMSVRRNHNGGGDEDVQPLSAEEEGAYSDVPSNTPSYKKRSSDRNDYDQVNIRPDSRELPKLPSSPEYISPRPSVKPKPSQPKDHKKKQFYPQMRTEPLIRSDPFASEVPLDDDDGPSFELPTRNGTEYETPRNSQKDGRFAGEGEGGYALPTRDLFDGGVSKRSNESGGYEVPDMPPPEYANAKKPEEPTTSTFYMSASTPPTYNNQNASTNGDTDEEDELSFPPPPPPLSPTELDEVEQRSHQTPRPLSFHHGQSGDGDNENEESIKKRRLYQDGFLNPLFDGQGPSDPTPSSSTDGDIDIESIREPRSGVNSSRPLSFHHGQTKHEEEEEAEEEDDDDDGNNKLNTRNKFDNPVFVNPTFDGEGPRGIDDEVNDMTVSRDADDDNDSTDVPNDDEVSKETDDVIPTETPTPSKPGVVPLYMENFGFDGMGL